MPLWVHVLLLAADKAPDLIDLDALAVQVAERAVLVGRACLAQVEQELADRVLGRAVSRAVARIELPSVHRALGNLDRQPPQLVLVDGYDPFVPTGSLEYQIVEG
jgi:hypothetical protein